MLLTIGGGTGPILLDDVECVGNESSLSECPHAGIENHNCLRSEDVGVRCGEDCNALLDRVTECSNRLFGMFITSAI